MSSRALDAQMAGPWFAEATEELVAVWSNENVHNQLDLRSLCLRSSSPCSCMSSFPQHPTRNTGRLSAPESHP